MGKKLARNVSLMDPELGYITLERGSEPTSDQAELITNPAAWEPESKEDRLDGGAWPPDGGLEAMDDEEVFGSANSTSVLEEGDLTPKDERLDALEGGDTPSYQDQTIPQLRILAVERDLDVTGLTRKQEFIDLLAEDDADNE